VNLLTTSAMLLPATLEASNKPRAALRFQVASALIMPAAMYIGAKHGIRGMMYGWCIAYPFVYSYLLLVTLTALQLPLMAFLRSCVPVLVGVLAMVAAVLACVELSGSLAEIYLLPLKVGVGAIAYVGSIWILFPKEVESIKEKLKFIRK